MYLKEIVLEIFYSLQFPFYFDFPCFSNILLHSEKCLHPENPDVDRGEGENSSIYGVICVNQFLFVLCRFSPK